MVSDKPTVIYLSLDKSKTFDKRHTLLTREIKSWANVREAVTKKQFYEHYTDSNLIGVIVTDAATITSTLGKNKVITEKLVALARDRGVTIIYGFDFPRKLFSSEPESELQDDRVHAFRQEQGHHVMVNIREVEKYMTQNWGESWCPDDYAVNNSYFVPEDSSLHDILRKNTEVWGATRMHTLPIRQVKYGCQQILLHDLESDASAVAFTSYGKGYVGMTAHLHTYVSMIPIYLAMLGFWGREGVRRREAEDKAWVVKEKEASLVD